MRRMIKSGVHIVSRPFELDEQVVSLADLQNPMSLDEDPVPYRFRFIFAKEEPILTVSRSRVIC